MFGGTLNGAGMGNSSSESLWSSFAGSSDSAAFLGAGIGLLGSGVGTGRFLCLGVGGVRSDGVGSGGWRSRGSCSSFSEQWEEVNSGEESSSSHVHPHGVSRRQELCH